MSISSAPRRGRPPAAVAAGLRKICTAPGEEAALAALAAFASSPLGQKYPQAATAWEEAREAFTPFLASTPPVRKLLYTTNSIESLNYQLRKVTKARGASRPAAPSSSCRGRRSPTSGTSGPASAPPAGKTKAASATASPHLSPRDSA